MRLTRACALAGALALMAGTLVTVADIALRPLDSSIFGATEMLQLATMAMVSLAIPYTFMTGGHVGVDMATDLVPPRGRAVFQGLAALLGLIFMTAIFWFGLGKAQQKIGYGDVSLNLGIPIGWFWGPMLLGFLLSMLATLLLAIGFFRHALTGRAHG